MNKTDYVEKMETLLQDQDTYIKKHLGIADAGTSSLIMKARQILNKMEKGRGLKGLLQEAPTLRL